jgi:UDP-N-acetylenolpyruvoylglucosamine reductase
MHLVELVREAVESSSGVSLVEEVRLLGSFAGSRGGS